MADKGKIIVIKDGDGGIINDHKTGIDDPFAQAHHKVLFLNVDDRVKFDIRSSGYRISVAKRIKCC